MRLWIYRNEVTVLKRLLKVILKAQRELFLTISGVLNSVSSFHGLGEKSNLIDGHCLN